MAQRRYSALLALPFVVGASFSTQAAGITDIFKQEPANTDLSAVPVLAGMVGQGLSKDTLQRFKMTADGAVKANGYFQSTQRVSYRAYDEGGKTLNAAGASSNLSDLFSDIARQMNGHATKKFHIQAGTLNLDCTQFQFYPNAAGARNAAEIYNAKLVVNYSCVEPI